MGVDQYTYVIYGKHIGEYDEQFQEAYDWNDKDLEVVFDNLWMDMKLGCVIFKSSGNGFEHNCLEIEFSPDNLSKLKEEYIAKFTAKYPDFSKHIAGEWKLLAFNYTCA